MEAVQSDATGVLWFPQVPAEDINNYLDASLLLTGWVFFVLSFLGDFVRIKEYYLVDLLTMQIARKILAYLRSVNIRFATTIMMLGSVLFDMIEFLVVMAVIMATFGYIFYTRLSPIPLEEFGFHDDRTHPWNTASRIWHTLFLLAFVGDLEDDAFPDTGDKYVLNLFLFIVVIVMLNVLIAIVSDAYDSAVMAAQKLYCRTQWSAVVEISNTYRSLAFPRFFQHSAQQIADTFEYALESTREHVHQGRSSEMVQLFSHTAKVPVLREVRSLRKAVEAIEKYMNMRGEVRQNTGDEF